MAKKETFNKLKINNCAGDLNSAKLGNCAGDKNTSELGFCAGGKNTSELGFCAGGSNFIPFPNYPRPQFKRDSFFNLNGKWDCGAVVPFPLGSENSQVSAKEEYSYYRTFSLPDDFIKDRVFLNFGAVDQEATVFIDGKEVGSHKGGYSHFSFDITDFLSKENPHKIQVDIIDRLDHKYPYGKQKKNRGGMWYTPISGIWQTVWLESVPQKYIRGIKITPNLEGIKLEIDGSEEQYRILIKSRADETEQELFTSEKSFYIKVQNPKLWAPEDPNLYDLTIEGKQDKIQSYFGLRTVGIAQDTKGLPRLLLNGKPYFFNGVLDQGYWPEGIFLPNSERGWEDDILAMKKLGFNTLRKHIKIESDFFYEACDRLGMVVFQDFVNNSDYSFFHDTVLPTLFNCHFDDHNFHKSSESRRIFKETVTDTIKSLYNFPCVCYYTIFNEGWGQFCADEMYDFVKTLDSTRIIDSTSGWFKQKKSDVTSDHVYFRKIKFKKSDKPIVISEFGGYSFKLEPKHYFNPNQNYGYKTFKTQEELEKDIHELYDQQIKPYVEKGLCAAIYTQLSDVEDETNGFLTYDRIPKVSSSFEVRME